MSTSAAGAMIVCGDKLALFGGGIEVGEDPLAAVIRELHEETTLEFDSADITPVSSYYRPDVKRMQHLFFLETTQRTFDVHEGDGVEWYTLDEVLARTDISYGLRVACSKYREMKEDN